MREVRTMDGKLTEAEVSRGGVMLVVRRSLILEPADFVTPSSTNFFT